LGIGNAGGLENRQELADKFNALGFIFGLGGVNRHPVDRGTGLLKRFRIIAGSQRRLAGVHVRFVGLGNSGVQRRGRG
jgi:hypothetical protein